MKKLKEKLNYFVGSYWNDVDNTLCIYAFGTQVQYGNERSANVFLEYVKEQSPDKDWQIFWIVTDRDEVEETPEEIRERLKKEYEENKEMYEDWAKQG